MDIWEYFIYNQMFVKINFRDINIKIEWSYPPLCGGQNLSKYKSVGSKSAYIQKYCG